MYKSEQWQKYDYTKIYINLQGEKSCLWRSRLFISEKIIEYRCSDLPLIKVESSTKSEPHYKSQFF